MLHVSVRNTKQTSLLGIVDSVFVHVALAPDAIKRNWGGCDPSNRGAIVRETGELLKMFPDLRTSLRRVLVKGNEAVIEVALFGTNTGPSPGPDSEPPTGRPFGEVGVRVVSFTPDGLIRDERDYFDVVTRKTQLHGEGPRVRAAMEAGPQGSPGAARWDGSRSAMRPPQRARGS